MNDKDIKAKKAAIRQEIKDRMQEELDERKKQIKKRIGQEKIPVEEKRRKYRNETHEEKLRLMEAAKEEFRARKRMLGLGPEEALYEEPHEEPPAVVPPPHEEGLELEKDDLQLREDDDFVKHHPELPAEEAFIYDDEDEHDALQDFQSPIGEHDAMHPEAQPRGVEGDVGPEVRLEEAPEANNLFYYIINLIFHPVQTLDEFDDYLSSPSGLAKVVIFYFVSLLPVVMLVLVGESISDHLPGGIAGNMIGSVALRQAAVLVVVGQTVLNLLIYSFSIAVVNYFITDEANFITLTVYFAFIEAVTRVVIYTLIILAIIAVVASFAAPQLMALVGSGVGLLILAFLFWTIALNIIVLMSAYGYDFLAAFLLAIGAFVFRKILLAVITNQLGISGF